MKVNSTVEYYNKNAKQFIEETKKLDMKDVYERFLVNIPDNARILDFGCGSGRDAVYFAENGYRVTAIDASEEICRKTSEYNKVRVKKLSFEELDENENYEGIWACASLLHVPFDELGNILSKIEKALTKKGIAYLSFKYGEFEGYRNEKYYTDMTEMKFSYIKSKCHMTVYDEWISVDVSLNRKEQKWYNIILVKG